MCTAKNKIILTLNFIIGKNEITKLVTDKKKQFGPLVRWLKVNFSECFCAWIHVKALRVFVESVLRYYTHNVMSTHYNLNMSLIERNMILMLYHNECDL